MTIATEVFSLRYWLQGVAWENYLLAFYIVVLFLFLILVLFLYAGFAVSNAGHSLSFTWPLTALRYICLLLSTVLFQPVLEMLVSMVSCGTNQGRVVLYMFSEVECFSGAHILHGCIALVASVLLTAITMAVLLLFFESRKQ